MNDNRKLEVHHAFHGLKPDERFSYRGFDVCVASSYKTMEPHPVYPEDFPNGYYESAYAIMVGDRVKFEQPLIFKLDHDNMWTEEARRKGRLDAAKAAAKSHVDMHHELGLPVYG